MTVLDLFSGYKLHEDGKILNRFNRPIKPFMSKEGYWRVELWNKGVGKKYLVHRLLAEAFIPNPEKKETVNHINGIKSDNRLENLEWATRSENQTHAYRNGLQRGYKKPTALSKKHKDKLCGSRWKKEKHIYKVNGKEYPLTCREVGKIFGVNGQTVLNRCKSRNYPNWEKEVLWLIN